MAFTAITLLVTLSSTAQQAELLIELGFEGRLTPNHYAPIRIQVNDYHSPDSSRLRLTQLAGNAWRGEATLQQDLASTVRTNGYYEAIVPIYDPANPILVELLSESDVVLASQTVDARDLLRPTPYPLLDRQLPRFDDRAAIVSPDSLPAQWWGYDSIETLWVASPLSSESWSAVSQWVLAGGSLVVLTGTNFYRMDSPALRALLPIEDPQVVSTNLGTSYLSGSHTNSTIDLLSDEGFPLLSHHRYGAGNVSLVSVQAQSLSVEDLLLISTYVATADLVSLEEFAETLLSAESVVALDSLPILAMIAVLAALVCICSIIGRSKPRIGWSAMLVATLLVSVSSGLISNPATHQVSQYAVNTHLYVQASFGFYAGSSCYFSLIPSSYDQMLKPDIAPLIYLPRAMRVANSFDSSASPGHLQQELSGSDLRRWHAYGDTSAVLDFEFIDATQVRITNFHADDFESAWLVMNGAIYPINQRVVRGNQVYRFDPTAAMSMGAFLSTGHTQNAVSIYRLVREMKELFDLGTGIWLIAANDVEQIQRGDFTRKVRDMTLVMTLGEGGAHEN